MSNTHDIDNEETFFQFDPYDEQQQPMHVAACTLEQQKSLAVATLPHTMSSHDGSFTSEELDIANEDPSPVVAKGKERTMPMPIRLSTIVHDVFDASPPSVPSTSSLRALESSSSSTTTFSPPSSTFLSSDLDNSFQHYSLFVDDMEDLHSSDFHSPSPGKGKEKETYPFLPPLSFSAMELNYGQDILSAPGPSSYSTVYSPSPTYASLTAAAEGNGREISILSPSHTPLPEPALQDVSTHQITRSQSLSNLSQSHSLLASVSTASNQQSAFGPARTPSNLSRQLIQDNNHNSLLLDVTTQVSEPVITRSDLLTFEREPGSYPPAWYTVSKPFRDQPGVDLKPNAFTPLKGKVRSKSSPCPLSALDYIPNNSTDIFQPLPIIVLNYFDLVLAKELRLSILRALVELHEEDLLRSIREGRLTMAKATSSKGRWVGRDKGIRELFKLSRVSKGWQSLVFDGELWTHLDLRSFPGLPPPIIVRLIKSAGTFIRSLNLAGHVQLLPDAMSNITNDLCPAMPDVAFPLTQLTRINVQGCSSLTTRSLHHLLVRSRSLEYLSLKGLSAVTNTTCDIIANFCPRLLSLNLSRCSNMDGNGISALTVSAILRKEHLPLKELHVSGLKHVSDSMMQALGRAAPYLEVLDLSYIRQLHNSAMEAFVACDSFVDQQHALETIVVSTRDLGRDTNEVGKLTRRVTRLRHLVLSSCILLTDTACANLAFSVPKLEFLEMAGFGADLKEEGLIRLLSTTPYIRRLDLEEAIDITDTLLAVITPPPLATPGTQSSDSNDEKHPGHALQQLNISYASNISDDALLSLIRNCTKLTVLEADNTRMGAAVLKEFVCLSRKRRATDAKVVAIDCRGISESLVKELSSVTRPRLGWRAYGARGLMYLDARDDNDEDLKIGQDECDEYRVVVKTFYSWQTVDAVKAAKEKRRKLTTRRTGSDSSGTSADNEALAVGRSARWWSPSGRRSGTRTIGQGNNSPPILPELNNDGCRTM